jgi:hypothetical protein
MDNFNKIISFVLGLVVVVVLLVILTGRFNLRERFLPLKDGAKVSVTPAPKAGATKAPEKKGGTAAQPKNIVPTQSYNYRSYTGMTKGGQVSTISAVTAIPNTGAPTLLIPMAIASLMGGVYLSKRK